MDRSCRTRKWQPTVVADGDVVAAVCRDQGVAGGAWSMRTGWCATGPFFKCGLFGHRVS